MTSCKRQDIYSWRLLGYDSFHIVIERDLQGYFDGQAWAWDFFMSVPQEYLILATRDFGFSQLVYIIAR